MGSNPTAVTAPRGDHWKRDTRAQRQHLRHRCRFGHPKHEGPEWGNQTRRATDTYDWGNQCLKTRNHEKEHEEDEAEELHAPPKKTRRVAERQGQPGSNTWTRPRYTRWAPVNKTILAFNHNCENILSLAVANMTVWPSGLRRWLQAPVRKGVGSNLTAVSAPSTSLAVLICW